MAQPIGNPKSTARAPINNRDINPPMAINIANDNIVASSTSVPEVKIDDMKNWLASLYDVATISDQDIMSFYDALSYKGFNRLDVLKQLSVLVKERSLVIQLIIAGALRGPQQGSKLKLSNGKSALEMGLPASGQKGNKTLTMNKIVSATSDLAAYFLKKMNVPKRMMSELPGWLQFPSAGGIAMPENYRRLHMDFARKFSEMIGGVFNEQIYMTMAGNSYLDPNLRLFD